MKKNLKNIIISSYDDISNPFYAGGGAVVIHKLAQELQSKYAVTVLTSKHKNASEDKKFDGVQYKRIGYTPNFFPQLGQLIFLLLLPFYAMSAKFDVWMESFTPPYSTAFLPLFTKKPVIGLAHYLAGKKSFEQYNIPFHLIENIGLKTYKQFIVPSDSVKKDIEQSNPDANILVIHNGIDLPLKVTMTHKKNQIAYIGRISVEQKGIDLLLNAFAKLPKSNKWELVIAGSGIKSEETKLKKLIADLKLENRVLLIGRVAKKNKSQLLKSASIFVVPSREETFSLSALEAMTYGLPIVSFDIPGLKWIPKDSGLKSRPFNASALKNALHTLITEKKLRNEIAQHNTKFSKQFSWKKISKQYYQAIEIIA